MKKIFSTLACCVFFLQSFAQVLATDDFGDQVRLYEDRKWEYVLDSILPLKEISSDSIALESTNDQIFLVKSRYSNAGIYINPKVWKFAKDPFESISEYTFENRNNELSFAYFYPQDNMANHSLEFIAAANLENVKAGSQVFELYGHTYQVINQERCILSKYRLQFYEVNYIVRDYIFNNGKSSCQFRLMYASKEPKEEFENECSNYARGIAFNIFIEEPDTASELEE